MNYTRMQLARLAPRQAGPAALAGARVAALEGLPAPRGRARLRCSATLMLGIQYFVLLPLFAFLARREARREPPGWSSPRAPATPLQRQY